MSEKMNPIEAIKKFFDNPPVKFEELKELRKDKPAYDEIVSLVLAWFEEHNES